MLDLIDTRTLFLVFALVSLFIGAIMVMVARITRSDISIANWATGMALIGAGSMLVTLRDLIPDVFSVLAANVIVLAGLGGMWGAVRQFHGLLPVWRLPGLVFGAGTLVVCLLYGSGVWDVTRTVFASALYGSLGLVIGWQVIRPARGDLRLPAWVTGGMLGIFGLMFLLRAVVVWRTGSYQVFGPQTPQSIGFLVLIMVVIASSAGFLMLTIVRLHGDLDRLATLDSLTEVYNRRSLDRLAAVEGDRARRTGQSLSMLVADLDHFKAVNDRYGHPAGDEVLRGFVRRAQASLRSHDLIGRYGGEEFLIVLPDTGREQALAVAERICRSVAALPVPLPTGETVPVTVSIGLAEAQGEAIRLEQMYSAADAALYRAKNGGRNQVVMA